MVPSIVIQTGAAVDNTLYTILPPTHLYPVSALSLRAASHNTSPPLSHRPSLLPFLAAISSYPFAAPPLPPSPPPTVTTRLLPLPHHPVLPPADPPLLAILGSHHRLPHYRRPADLWLYLATAASTLPSVGIWGSKNKNFLPHKPALLQL
ncbi:hypothetical protein PVAP13_8NG224402 [Panicum virgatum]|uniref:Uncharacterized protein n=1 Tax=Panicum virgatum TaxID=38727 RepID=A0A8T0PAF9_PANVG|nr:hypothetical protein PVAP13_8NG224402 [Panicum virgatum]